MRLLYDQNLPPALVSSLADLFPDSQHVREVGLRDSPDAAIWQHAKRTELTIVTKDNDYHQMSRVRGAPPKVVWLRLGNCSVADLERVLRAHAADLRTFHQDPVSAILIIE